MRLGNKTAPATEIQMRWLHAGRPSIVAEKPLPGRSNYLIGSDPSRWIEGIPQSAQIRYHELYRGIDLVFHGTGDSIEHDFEVQAGADPTKIAFRLDRPVVVGKDQSLQVVAGGHALQFARPLAYQQYRGERKQIPVAFLVSSEGVVTFRLGKYDSSKALIIDPVLTFSTYLTGANADTIRAITTDASGNVYVTGETTATDFPLKNPEQSTCSNCANGDSDVFVTKLDPTGHTLLYSTYLGGSSGAEGGSIAVDGQGNIVVSGAAVGGDFPHTQTAPATCQTTASCFFLTSLKPNGASFNYSILLGGSVDQPGSGNDGSLALDSAGNAYFAGNTDDANFPTTPGTLSTTVPGYPNTTLVVLKVDTTGALTYSTAIPGNAPANPANSYTNFFQVEGIAVDTNGQVSVAGTSGPGLPATSGALEPSLPVSNTEDAAAGFVLQLNSTATALNYATYLPGTDNVAALAVAGDGSLYLAGSTAETNLPVSANAYLKTLVACPNGSCSAGYIMKLDSSAKTVVAATYLEGTDPTQNGGAMLQGMSLDSHANPVVGGLTGSTAFPLVNPFVSQFETSSSDVALVIAQLSSDLSTLLFGSFLSSTTANPPFAGSLFNAIAVDPSDHVLVAGTTFAADFPTTPASFEPQLPLQPDEGQTESHAFLASLNLATPAPSVCLSNWQISFGLVPALTKTSQTLTLTNCGNAPLHLTSYTSSFPTFAASGSCADVAAGSTCAIQVSFSPVNSTLVSATITLTDDAAIAAQTVGVSGQGLAPDLVPLPTSLNVGHLLVGTQGPPVQIFLENQGSAPLVVSALSVSGDFSLAANGCATPAPAPTSCPVSVRFTPTAAGARTGALTITSNDPANPQLSVPLSGVGDSVYATPVVTSIEPKVVLLGVSGQQLQVTGSNFYPASVVSINGKAQATTFVSNTQLTAAVDGPSVAAIGEEPVTVSTPTPGGGESNAVPLTPYQTLAINPSFLISVPAAGMLYASIPASSVTHPNTIVPIDPATGKMGTPIPVGQDPRVMAASDDGKYIYVALYADQTIQRVNLRTSAVERTFPFPTASFVSDPPFTVTDMHVVPGANQSVVVAFPDTIALFNDSGLVNVIPGSYPGLDLTAFTFLNNPNAFYALPLDFRTNAPEIYTIGSTGLETTVPSGLISGLNGNGGFLLATDGTLLFTSNGSVWDPATPKLLGTFQLSIENGNSAASAASLTADAGPGQVYFLGDQPYNNNSALVLSAFDKTSFTLVGSLPFEQVNYPFVSNLVRWGSNGFSFIAPGNNLTDQEVYILTSSLAPASATNPVPTVSAILPTSAVAGAAAFPLTVNGSGFLASSVVAWNGTPLVTTFVSGTQLTATVPAADVVTAGAAPVTVENPAPGGGASAAVTFTIAAAPGQLSVSPGTIAFGSESVGVASAAQTVTLTNTGGQAISLAGIAASSQFSETNNCGSALSPAAACKVSVIFTPSASGSQAGTLTLTDDAVSSPQTVTLSGTGVASALSIAAGSGGSTSATITSGQSATYSLSLTGSPGLTGTVTLTCSGAPAGAVCSVTPASLNLISGQSSSFTVTVDTAANKQLALSARAGCLYLSSLVLLSFFVRVKRVRGVLLACSLLIVCAAGLAGCGGQSSGSTGSGGGGVAPGSYSLHVSAAEGSVTVTQSLSLTVQ